MAEFGSHLTGQTVSDDSVPSIFDVLAQESLLSSLRPALKHVFRVFAGINPTRYGFLFTYNDEIFLGLQVIIENYYLRTYSASFSENFYGLKRVPTRCVIGGSQKDGLTSDFVENMPPKLNSSEHWRSIIFLVLVPYIKHKCDSYYTETLASTSSSFGNQNQNSKLVRAYLAVYPYVNMLWEGTLLFFQLSYIVGKHHCYSPYHLLSGVVLRLLSDDDLHRFDIVREKLLSEAFQGKSFLRKFVLLMRKLLFHSASFLANGFSCAVFFLQFLDWWFTSDHRSSAVLSLPIPDHPPIIKSDKLPASNVICPLCNKVRSNDTALSVSGYVFCYRCIHDFVKEKLRCPVTGYPARVEHLVKIYAAES